VAATTVLIQPDPFVGTAKKVQSYVPTPDRYGLNSAGKLELNNSATGNPKTIEALRAVPRPINGITVKPNTPAYIQVVTSNGDIVDVFDEISVATPDGGIKKTPQRAAWTSWFLQSVREDRVEKTQLVETFGDSYIYSYGEKPRTLMFQGLLLNTEEYNWRAQFWKNWEQNFRATRLVESQARMYVRFDDILVEGYPINATVGQSSDSPNIMPFSFMFFVTNQIDLSALSNPESPATFTSTTNMALIKNVQEALDLRSEFDVNRRNTSLLGKLGLNVQATDTASLAKSALGDLISTTITAARYGPSAALAATLVSARVGATRLLSYYAQGKLRPTGMSSQEFNEWFGGLSNLLSEGLRIALGLTSTLSTTAAEKLAIDPLAGFSPLKYALDLLAAGTVSEVANRMCAPADLGIEAVVASAGGGKPSTQVTFVSSSALNATGKSLPPYNPSTDKFG